MLPHDYYILTPFEFHCTMKGFENKERKNAMLFRAVAYQTYTGMGGKKPINEFWKIGKDKPIETVEEDANLVDRIKNKYNIR